MQRTIIITGFLILITAFSYSAVTTLGRTDTLAQNETDIETVRETMPMMNDTGMPMAYSDGTYETSVKYEVPYGYVESMDATITITDGVVTDSEVAFEIVNPVSNDYVDSFERYYKDEIVGQPVDDISLSRVGGASLTNVAFDAALQNIKNQAAGGMMNSMAAEDEVLPLLLPGTLTEDGIVLSARPDAQAEPADGMMNSVAKEAEVLPSLLPDIVTPEGIVIRPRPDAPTESEQESRGLKVTLVDQDPENTSDSQYQNGTYMVELAYFAWPKLYEPMRTQITLKDGIIVDAQQSYATIDYTHSVGYQQHFDSLYKNVVIGMPLDDAPIARVGQASETTDGFNDALLAIKERAQN